MDTRTQQSPDVPLILLGSHWVGPQDLKWDQRPASAEAVFDVAPLLKDRKTIKLMAKQDRMALAAAAGALRQAGLSESDRRDRTGVYAAAGALAFDEEELQMLADLCIHNGQVDAYHSASHVYQAMNPLTTFKCLPNMAVFHISVNLGMNGPYLITYPGTGQWHSALLRAWHDLADGVVDFALVGSVAEQNNLPVGYHFDRLYGAERPPAIDCAAFWLLACDGPQRAASTARLLESAATYESRGLAQWELPSLFRNRPFHCGPSEIALRLCLAQAAGDGGPFEYQCETWDGISCRLRGQFSQ